MINYAFVVIAVLLVLAVAYLRAIRKSLDRLYNGLSTVQGTQWEYQIGAVPLEGESFPLIKLNLSVRELGKLGYEAMAVWMTPENADGKGISVLMKRPIIR